MDLVRKVNCASCHRELRLPVRLEVSRLFNPVHYCVGCYLSGAAEIPEFQRGRGPSKRRLRRK